MSARIRAANMNMVNKDIFTGPTTIPQFTLFKSINLILKKLHAVLLISSPSGYSMFQYFNAFQRNVFILNTVY